MTALCPGGRPHARPGAERGGGPSHGHTRPLLSGLRAAVLPGSQRRTLDELTEDLDLRSGESRSKQSAFWTMLVLSGVIATAGILADSTATSSAR